jgi:hypothetical protein
VLESTPVHETLNAVIHTSDQDRRSQRTARQGRSNSRREEDIFIAQDFLPQPEEEGNIEILDTRTSVRACEVREALFTQSVKKAPSLDGASFKALRLLWGWVEERIVALVRGCIRKGYYPCIWKTAKGVLLQKQGKPTYAVAKAY